MTAKAPVGNARPFRMIAGVSTLADLADGSSAYGYPGNYPGKIYFVNNVTGASTNDGSDWDHAFAQIDQALLASETRRVSTANLRPIRNRIFVQGTGTAYAAVDQDFNNADLIGIGNIAHLGGAAGDVMVSGAGAADGFAQSILTAGWDTTLGHGGGIGINVFNVHFEATGAYWAADLVDWLDSKFEDCSFCCSGANSDGGIRATEHFAGSKILRCLVMGDAGAPAIGMSFSGGVFNNTEIANCVVYARTTGYTNSCYLQDCSWIHDNMFYGGTTGLSDTSAETTLFGLASYTDNKAFGATAFTCTNQSKYRCLNNTGSNGSNVVYFYAYG